MARRSRTPESIVVTGSLAYDQILEYGGDFREHVGSSVPRQISLSFLVESSTKRRGGCAGNIAYNLSLLGDPSRVLAAIGTDGLGYLKFLSARGIDTSAVHVSPSPTASCVVFSDRVGNQVVGFHPGAMSEARALSVRDATRGLRRTLVFIAPDDPEAMLRHVGEARATGLPFFFDPSFQVTALDGASLARALNGAAALFMNECELEIFQGKTRMTSRQILSRVPLVVITHGARGSEIRTAAGTTKVPAVAVERCVDPTGAGDAFRAGFLHGWWHTLSVETCARLGSTVASFAIQAAGGQEHVFSLPDVYERYATVFGLFPGEESRAALAEVTGIG